MQLLITITDDKISSTPLTYYVRTAHLYFQSSLIMQWYDVLNDVLCVQKSIKHDVSSYVYIYIYIYIFIPLISELEARLYDFH